MSNLDIKAYIDVLAYLDQGDSPADLRLAISTLLGIPTARFIALLVCRRVSRIDERGEPSCPGASPGPVPGGGGELGETPGVPPEVTSGAFPSPPHACVARGRDEPGAG